MTTHGTPEGWPDREELLTAHEVAAILKVPVGWVYEHCRARAHHRLPGFKLGKYWRFRETEVLAWVNGHAVEQRG